MKKIMNPWGKTPDKAPYVLENDKKYIKAFNELNKNNEFKIKTNFTPEPRLGDINSPVIFLQLNPSYSDTREKEAEKELRLKSLKDERYAHLGANAGAEWWGKRLNELANDVGGFKTLSKNICSVEFFPYRSKKFNHGSIRLPSQEYTFSIVRKGLKNNSIFIITRNLPLWCSAVPELTEQINKTVFSLNNPRASYFTRGNMPKGTYDKIVNRIK